MGAEDTITLTDGRTISGTIAKEDGETVYLEQKDGELRPIVKSRIAKIERSGAKANPSPPTQPAPAPPVPQGERGAGANPSPPTERAGTPAPLLTEFKELGSPDPEKRKAALQKVLQDKQSALPVLLAMLHPKMETDEWTRIGALRALAELAPLTEQAAKTIGWVAVMDPYPEARREACVVVRRLQDDRATRELAKFSASEDPAVRRAAAAALHELDDSRVWAALIREIHLPGVTANNEDGSPQFTGRPRKPDHMLPVGPGGAKVPIFLPQGGVMGVATDIGGPITELLKQATGKDLGNLPYGWLNWLREKEGEITSAERDAYRENRSMRERMNAP